MHTVEHVTHRNQQPWPIAAAVEAAAGGACWRGRAPAGAAAAALMGAAVGSHCGCRWRQTAGRCWAWRCAARRARGRRAAAAAGQAMVMAVVLEAAAAGAAAAAAEPASGGPSTCRLGTGWALPLRWWSWRAAAGTGALLCCVGRCWACRRMALLVAPRFGSHCAAVATCAGCQSRFDRPTCCHERRCGGSCSRAAPSRSCGQRHRRSMCQLAGT